jgi:hypothetical protein
MPRFTASPSAAIKLTRQLCKTGSAAPARFGGLVARLRLLVDHARTSLCGRPAGARRMGGIQFSPGRGRSSRRAR